MPSEKFLPIQVLFLAIADVVANPNSPRRHRRRKMALLEKSMKAIGCRIPILVDESNVVIAGHARLTAAKNLGWTHIPAICADDLTEPQKRAFMIADNKLAEDGEWDNEQLREIFQELSVTIPEFDLELTGFTTGEIDLIIDTPTLDLSGADPDDEDVDVNSVTSPVSRVGDVFILGNHRLVCGDARDPEAYTLLLQGSVAQMVFTDPPYDVRINGNVSRKHGEFVEGSGEMGSERFTGFLSETLGHATDNLADGAILFVCMDWRHVVELKTAGDTCGLDQKNVCCWVKTNAGMGTFYRSQHELIFVFKSGTAAHINNFGLGDTGRHRSNVWEYPGQNTFGPNREEDLADHPTVKPVALVADAIRDCSHRGGLILDPFSGSGTTILAAERTRRRARCIELDPRFVDVAIQRWRRRTGQPATHEASGLTFEELGAQRSSEHTRPTVRLRRRTWARPGGEVVHA